MFIIARREREVAYRKDVAVGDEFVCWLSGDNERAPTGAVEFNPQLSPPMRRVLVLAVQFSDALDERGSLRRVFAAMCLQAYVTGRRAERRRNERLAERETEHAGEPAPSAPAKNADAPKSGAVPPPIPKDARISARS